MADDRNSSYHGFFAGRRVVITGGAGFIGSHLAHRLVALDAEVRVLDDLSGGFRRNVPTAATLIEASILDDDARAAAVEGCDVVFHEAAMVSVPESVAEPLRCSELNITGTERVLESARDAGVQRVIFAASAAAYGPEPALPCREDQPPDCVSPYAASKVAGEAFMSAFGRCYDLSTVSLRYFNIFGPRQNPDSPYAAVISAFEKALRAGNQPTIFGDGSQTRDFTHVDNVVHANLLAASHATEFAGEIINIGTGQRIDLLTVLRTMAEILGREVEPDFDEPRAGDVPHSVADVSRAKALLDYEPIVDFEEGLRRTLLEPVA